MTTQITPYQQIVDAQDATPSRHLLEQDATCTTILRRICTQYCAYLGVSQDCVQYSQPGGRNPPTSFEDAIQHIRGVPLAQFAATNEIPPVRQGVCLTFTFGIQQASVDLWVEVEGWAFPISGYILHVQHRNGPPNLWPKRVVGTQCTEALCLHITKGLNLVPK